MARPGQKIYSSGDYVVNVANREVMKKGKEVKIQRRVFDLLVYLIENRDRTVDKDELLDQVWKGRITTDAALSRVVMKARKVLDDDAKKQSMIKTLHGQGYRFVGQLEAVDKEDGPIPAVREGRSRLPRFSIILSLVISTLVAAAGISWYVMTSTTQPPASTDSGLNLSVESWRQADMLLQRDLLWRGGDGPVSVDLGGGRIAWFFGVSQVAQSPTFERTGLTTIANSVAIQRGYDPLSAEIDYFWNDAGGVSTSYFPESNGYWYWPQDALLLDQQLLVLLQETRSSNEGLGFEAVRMVARLIVNPFDPPTDWRMRDLTIPGNDVGVLPGSAALVAVDDYVYAFSKQEPTADIYLARWSPGTMEEAGALQFEWWCGDECGWTYHTDQLASARPVLSDTHISFSVRRVQDLDKYLLLESWGFGSAVIAARTSDSLTGPWSEREIIHDPEEKNWKDVMIYSARVHDGLIGADLVATYNVNSNALSGPRTDNNIDFPRFIKIEIDKQPVR